MMTRFSIVAAVLLSVAGCSYNYNFVYKPGTPVPGVAKVPVKVAVVSFSDGTEDFTKRGSVMSGGYFNLAKSGYSGMIEALPPQIWAKFFADDLAASGSFRSARFVFDVSEAADDEVIVGGAVTKAYFAIHRTEPSRFALALNARRGRHGSPFWEKSVSSDAALGKAYGEGCGLSIQCSLDLVHGHHNRMMQALFAEARADLLRALEPAPGSGEAIAAPTPAPSPSPESVEKTIDRILNGN
jgi:hypothetical protein